MKNDKTITLVAATGNKHKIVEISETLAPFGFEVISKDDAGAAKIEPEETGLTFEENAIIKAKAIMQEVNLPTIADDSGLEVDALNGAPGIYSARFYAVAIGDEKPYEVLISEPEITETNNEKLLRLLKDIPLEKRTARFVCAIALLRPDTNEPIVVRGICEGKIDFAPSGEGGFGYDPLFIPNEYADEGLSFAALTSVQKNMISHRGRALEALRGKFKD